MRRETWEIFPRKSVADHNVITGTWSFKFKITTGWNIRTFKAQYCVGWDFQNRMSLETLNQYSPVVQWAKVSLMLN